MFTFKYDSYTKDYIIFKDNEVCAKMTRCNLILETMLTMGEVCDILDLVEG